MRYWRTLLVVGLAATAFGVGLPTTIAAAKPLATSATVTPYCGFYWGSLLKQHTATAVAPLTNVRAGRHTCFDRLVLDMSGKADGYRVEYVTQVYRDGSGLLVPLRGGARLSIIAIAPAHDDAYRPTYRPANPAEMVNVSGWRTFRQVSWAGTFEGQSTIGLGVRARLPFRVFTLDGPGAGSRIVIDVAHRW
jgi:hypothetical protein